MDTHTIVREPLLFENIENINKGPDLTVTNRPAVSVLSGASA
jgi:hypothetical protein